MSPTDLEVLRVRLVAEASQYKRELDAVVQKTRTSVANIEAELKRLSAAYRTMGADVGRTARSVSTAASHFGVYKREVDSATKANAQHAARVQRISAAHAAGVRSSAAWRNAMSRPPTMGAGYSRTSMMGSMAGTVGNVAGSLARYGRRAALGVGGIAAASIGAYATFDDSINRSVAVAGGASDKLRRQLENNAKQIARSSITSAHDVARSYLEMVQAGYSLGDSLKYVRDIQRFSVAANLDMARSVELLSQSTKALGMTGPDAMKQSFGRSCKSFKSHHCQHFRPSCQPDK